MNYYYDTFSDEVVTEIDTIAPPERYIKIHEGSDVFIEKWFLGDNKYLDVAYTPYDRAHGFDVSIRNCLEINHEVSLLYMTDWTVTKEHYKKVVASVGR